MSSNYVVITSSNRNAGRLAAAERARAEDAGRLVVAERAEVARAVGVAGVVAGVGALGVCLCFGAPFVAIVSVLGFSALSTLAGGLAHYGLTTDFAVRRALFQRDVKRLTSGRNAEKLFKLFYNRLGIKQKLDSGGESGEKVLSQMEPFLKKLVANKHKAEDIDLFKQSFTAEERAQVMNPSQPKLPASRPTERTPLRPHGFNTSVLYDDVPTN